MPEVIKRGAGWVRRRISETDSKAETITAPISEPEADSLININTASVDELTELDGVDHETATRIVVHRPFESVDDLTRVGGIGSGRLERNRGRITV